MFATQRQQAIVAALRRFGRVDSLEVARDLGVTRETVRKDLIELEKRAQLRRVHGGAVPIAELTFEPAVSARTGMADEKSRIAQAALAEVPREGSVLIDAGSTTARLAELFPADRELTVFTNTLSVAMVLLSRPALRVYTLGGRVRSRTVAEVGPFTARALSEINVDVAFMGTNAISLEGGLTTPDPEEAEIKRLMITRARRRIALADHSKFGAMSLCRFAGVSDLDLLITDTGLSGAEAARYQAGGAEILRV
ncbi:MAG: DeoR/GlpR family DNA-binding transcription regulator [Actinomycetota bacterium]|nr:DeoR/GlpR family DNA-binding transcription regulator [Actinomycetota bacterium]